MLRRAFTIVGWGSAGIAVAAVLIAGAFAVAGSRLTEPATPIRVSTHALVPETLASQDAESPGPVRSPAVSTPTSVGSAETPPATSTHSTAPGSDDGNGRRDDGGRGDSDGDD